MKSTVDAKTNAAHCVAGKNGNVKIVRRPRTMNVGAVADRR